MFPLELLADLPEPRRDEPASLRIDIADELTDHLVCAFRREVLRDGDEAAARQRTLDRFGDPKQLARRLWWQAMWSRIMRQRIVSALQWSVAVLAMLISVALFHQQSQMLAEMRQARQDEAAQRQEDAAQRREDAAQRQALTARLDQLHLQAAAPEPTVRRPNFAPGKEVIDPVPTDSDPHSARTIAPRRATLFGNDSDDLPLPVSPAKPEFPAPSLEPPQLTVQLVQEGADKSPIALGSAHVTIADNRGTHLHGDRIPPTIRVPRKASPARSDPDPAAVVETLAFGFQSLDPGHYDLTVQLADGQHSVRPVLIRDNKPQELTIGCPPPRQKASLQISVPPLPEDLRVAAAYLDVKVVERPVTVDEVEWLPASQIVQALTFDPKTARAIRLTREDPQLAAADQRIDLQKVKPEDCLVFVDSGAIALNFQLGLIGPPLGPGGPSNVYSVIYPAESTRDAKAGENRWQLELPEELLADAREKLNSLSSPRAAYAPPAPSPADAPSPPARKAPQLTIKCIAEGLDVPPPKVYQVSVRSADSSAIADRVSSGEDQLYAFETLLPDQYELTIVMADQQFSVQPLLVADEKPRELTMVCPGPRKKVPVGITIPPLPEKLLGLNLDVQMVVGGGPVEIGKQRWVAPGLPTQMITFDPKTGLPREIESTTSNGQQRFDLSAQSADERRVFLPVGTAHYRFRVSEHVNGVGAVPVFIWPNAAHEEPGLKHVIRADEKSWKLELPQQYLDEILQGITQNPATAPAYGAPQPNSEQGSINRPNPFAHQAAFQWIRGLAKFDELNKTWSVLYSHEDPFDQYQGWLTLAFDPKLSCLKPNDVVLVRGRLDEQSIDGFGKPKYRIDELQRLRPKRPPQQHGEPEILRVEVTTEFD